MADVPIVPHNTVVRSSKNDLGDYLSLKVHREGWDNSKGDTVLIIHSGSEWIAHIWYDCDPRQEIARVLKLGNCRC